MHILVAGFRRTMYVRGIITTICLLLLSNEARRHRCDIDKLKLHANCSFRNLNHVPKFPGTIVYLNLQGNTISHLYSESFESLQNLQVLHLDQNKITIIDENAFHGLKSLKILTLSKNKLDVCEKQFQKRIFRFTKSVTHLDLSKNLESSRGSSNHYPDETFADLINLKELIIDLHAFPVFGKGFRNLSKLESLIFDRCFVKKLVNSTFQNFGNISCLSMTGCTGTLEDVPVMETGVFRYLHSLKRLDLSHSYFTLPVVLQSLGGLHDMDVLNLYSVNSYQLLWSDRDYYVHVTKHMTRFYRNMCIKHVNLGNNGIGKMESQSLFSFKDPTCLESYILSENNFMLTFPRSTTDILLFLRMSTNLKIFDFSYMLIKTPFPLQLSMPESSKGCSDLSVSESITYTKQGQKTRKPLPAKWPKVSVPCPRNIKTFRVSNVVFPFYVTFLAEFKNCKNLELFDISYSTVLNMDFEVRGLENTRAVNFSGLDFEYNGKLLLNSFSKTKYIVLQNTNLDRSFRNGHNILKSLLDLEILDVSQNHLNDLPLLAINHMSKLREVNLSVNSFDQFPISLFSLNNLNLIDLRFNKISQINKTILNWLDRPLKRNQTMILLIEGNTFACVCNNINFIRWLYTTSVKVLQKEHFTCVTSTGERVLIKHVYLHFNEYFNRCKSDFMLAFGITGLSLLGVILFLCIVAYRFRWRIVYFFYRNCKRQRPPENNAFDFDAFVGYAGAEYRWIFHTLKMKLQDEYNLEICLHDKDFEIGVSISQNIVDFIRKSRKIVFDVTPEYLKAKWCEFEIEMAKNEVFQRGSPKDIIVIIRCGVRPEDMPRSIKDIWSHVTCIIYPEDETDEEAKHLFWSRLYHAIIDIS